MKYKAISPNFFINNRNKLVDQLIDNSFLILFSSEEYPRNGDQFFPFRQNSDLYFLTGIDQENTALIIWKNSHMTEPNTLLFVKKTDKNQEIWYGRNLSCENAAFISGIDEVKYFDEVDFWISKLSKEYQNVYTWQPVLAKFNQSVLNLDKNLLALKREELTALNHLNLYDITSKLRLVKSAEELETINKAVDITNSAYLRVLQNLKPGMKEYEVEADITYEFLRGGATGHAYAPIIAGGENACILHYTDNDKLLKDGDLLLLDFGAEYGNYAADCSRTIPVNGRFSPRQAACYNAVLDVFKKAIKLFVPGNTIDNINIQTGLWLQEKMENLGLLTKEEIEIHQGENPVYFKYFMHGTSHFIGLDVHDVGSKQTVFEKGMVLSCEPGLYIAEENMGIRIETDVLVDDEPIDLLADFAVEIEDIERLMTKKILKD